jgi:hypothetical protein
MSTLIEIATTVLKKGLIVKFVIPSENKQDNKYYVVAQSKWLKTFNIESPHPDEAFVDIILDRAIDISNFTPTLIEYISAPEHISIEDLITPSETFKKLGDNFLESNKEYLYKAMKAILGMRLAYKEYMDYYTDNFKDLNYNNMKDVYCLRFYPKKIQGESREEVYNSLIEDLTIKYFTHSAPDFGLPTENALIPALQILGTATSNIFNFDPDFINAVRNQWSLLILKERDKSIADLTKQLKLLEKYSLAEEKDEMSTQIQEMINLLNGVSLEPLNKVTTVAGIISYWPEVMQPTPFYVFEG